MILLLSSGVLGHGVRTMQRYKSKDSMHQVGECFQYSDHFVKEETNILNHFLTSWLAVVGFGSLKHVQRLNLRERKELRQWKVKRNTLSLPTWCKFISNPTIYIFFWQCFRFQRSTVLNLNSNYDIFKDIVPYNLEIVKYKGNNIE